ncbi:uncharacterized protein LOC141743094 [Larus michahellis]|uniref:uncharacterized protein LOC141743094 n=1 Tax=Larus michahellis TaxID=119627 RepID=UPI003D9B995B
MTTVAVIVRAVTQKRGCPPVFPPHWQQESRATDDCAGAGLAGGRAASLLAGAARWAGRGAAARGVGRAGAEREVGGGGGGGERGAAGAQVGPAAPRHPPGAGEPLTNAHCALGDSTVRVTAANLLLGHRCAAASPCFASTDLRLDAMTPATTPRHPEIALRLGLCCLMTNPWRCHWQKQLRRSPGKTCPSYHEQHCGVNASDFLLPTEPSCSAPGKVECTRSLP